MRLTGTRLDGPNWETSHRVAEAVVTSERIALDWIENGVRYHLLAHSQDGGLTYQGNYGMFRPEEQWGIGLTRYTAVDGSVGICPFCRTCRRLGRERDGASGGTGKALRLCG